MGSKNVQDDLINSSIYYCKVAKFQENIPESDDYLKLASLRRITSQLGSLSNVLSDNSVSCSILNENLKNYSELVDNKQGVNNYAESVQALVKYVKSAQCQKWKSSLQDDKFLISDFLPKRHCENSSNACKRDNINEDDVKNVLKNYKNELISSNNFGLQPNLKQECLSTPETNSSLSKAIDFNQKRKNNAFPEDQLLPNSFKTRKLNNKDFNNFTKTDKHGPTAVAPNRCQTIEPVGYSKPNSNPLLQFKTASAELRAQNKKKFGGGGGNRMDNSCFDNSYQQPKKSLGSRPRPVSSKFVIPLKSNNSKNEPVSYGGSNSEETNQEDIDPLLQHIEPKMIEMIRSEIMDCTNPITWDDIAGLQYAKSTIQEIVVWPMLRPDIFTGLRRPPKGILLFGPPGTGKTLIAKCIASQSKSTFFSISASSLTSKWIGDGEKMVRALFAVARVDQPSVVFIDEIDSLLSKRSDTEHESSRRIKTEFLVQLDGATTGEEDRLLIIGATNRPQELDEAARRRLVKRLYIPLPDQQARIEMVTRLMSKERNNLTAEEIALVGELTDGYSGADVKILCQEAALGPIRSISYSQIEQITTEQVRPVTMDDFRMALARVRSSVSSDDLQCYIDWDKTYGSGSI